MVEFARFKTLWGALQSEAKAFALVPNTNCLSSKYAFKQVSLYRHLRKSTSCSLLPPNQSSVGTHRNIQNE